MYVYIYIYALWGAAESIVDKNHPMKTKLQEFCWIFHSVAQELRRFLHKIDPTLTDQVHGGGMTWHDALTASILSQRISTIWRFFLKWGLLP